MRGIEKGEQPVGGTVRTHTFFLSSPSYMGMINGA